MSAYSDLIDRIAGLSPAEARAALMLVAYQHEDAVTGILDRIQDGGTPT